MIESTPSELSLSGKPVAFEDVGLIWDQENRRLYDPETGEVVLLEAVVDEGTAKAAAFRIWGTEASIAVLKSQKKLLDQQIKQRELRLKVLKELHLEGMSTVAKSLMEKAKSKAKSIRIGLAVVGWRASSASVGVKDTSAAAAFLKDHAPEAMRFKVHMDLIPEDRRKAFATYLFNLSQVVEDAVDIDFLVSNIPDSLTAALPSEGFVVEVGGEDEWYVKGDKPKGGEDAQGV